MIDGTQMFGLRNAYVQRHGELIMTPREQIEAAKSGLVLLETSCDRHAVEFLKHNGETIRRCLEFTLRAMGEPSKEMIGSAYLAKTNMFSDAFKAMTAKLWQEVCDG